MILYSAPSSYYSMIARLALWECDASFNIRRMDIHIAKEQLSSWYVAINPAMTVPTLTDDNQSWKDSHAILEKAALIAGDQWYDADENLAPQIKKLVDANYSISIEHLTFGKAMTRIKLLRMIIPHMLRRIIKKLESNLPSSANPQATQQKITLNQQRLSYFTEGDLNKKLIAEREHIKQYLNLLPVPSDELLFGNKPSSADIVTAILLARLKMIGEIDLVKPFPALSAWFEHMQARPSFKQADIWTRFQPWRIVLKY
jgi:glutathione S-transferase